MHVVYKWTLKLDQPMQSIVTPYSTKFFQAQMQEDSLVVWGKVNKDYEKGIMSYSPEERIFRLVMTGSEFNGDNCTNYLNTVQLKDGTVLHIFVK